MRTEQDDNITLYTIAELQAMKRVLESNKLRYSPFSLAEINHELLRREQLTN